MRKYELAVVLTEEAGKDKTNLKKEISAELAKVKGKLISADIREVKELSYPIKKHDKGCYAFFEVELETDKIDDLDKQLKIKDKILRFLLVRAEPVRDKK